MVEAPGVILRPGRRDATTPQQQQQPPDWTAYTDGSEDGGRAGWAYAVVMGGDGISDENAMLVTEGYGPVVTSPVHAAFVGARKHTNNTAELSALAELFRSLLHTAPRVVLQAEGHHTKDNHGPRSHAQTVEKGQTDMRQNKTVLTRRDSPPRTAWRTDGARCLDKKVQPLRGQGTPRIFLP